MLHLMSQLPANREEWLLVGAMMSLGDDLVIYQKAAKEMHSEVAQKAIKELSSLGVKSYIQADADLKLKSDFIIKKVSWLDIVKLVENTPSVNSL